MVEQKVVALQRAESRAAPRGAVLGWVDRVDEDGIWVDSHDSEAGPMLAICVAPLGRAELDAAIADRRDAVLLPVSATGQPVLLGLRQPMPAIEAELPSEDSVAMVDGKRVRLEGQDEVVLRCGKASITLRKNGRVVIRGVQVESRATGRNRIKGGAVLIN